MVKTRELAVYPSTIDEKVYLGLGLAGETGEVVDILKKIIRADEEERKKYKAKEKLHDELGDVLWYWVRICDAFGFSPSAIMDANIEKLQERKARKTLKFR
jgi:NTP pyrophosphatase (non-canonical NTP hydrolase)